MESSRNIYKGLDKKINFESPIKKIFQNPGLPYNLEIIREVSKEELRFIRNVKDESIRTSHEFINLIRDDIINDLKNYLDEGTVKFPKTKWLYRLLMQYIALECEAFFYDRKLINNTSENEKNHRSRTQLLEKILFVLGHVLDVSTDCYVHQSNENIIYSILIAASQKFPVTKDICELFLSNNYSFPKKELFNNKPILIGQLWKTRVFANHIDDYGTDYEDYDEENQYCGQKMLNEAIFSSKLNSEIKRESSHEKNKSDEENLFFTFAKETSICSFFQSFNKELELDLPNTSSFTKSTVGKPGDFSIDCFNKSSEAAKKIFTAKKTAVNESLTKTSEKVRKKSTKKFGDMVIINMPNEDSKPAEDIINPNESPDTIISNDKPEIVDLVADSLGQTILNESTVRTTPSEVTNDIVNNKNIYSKKVNLIENKITDETIHIINCVPQQKQKKDDVSKKEENKSIKNNTVFVDTSLNVNRTSLIKTNEQQHKMDDVSKDDKKNLIQNKSSTLPVDTSLNINEINLTKSKEQEQKEDDVKKEAENQLIQNTPRVDSTFNINKTSLGKSKEQEQKKVVSKGDENQSFQNNNTLLDTSKNINKASLTKSNEQEQKKETKDEVNQLIHNKNCTLLVDNSLNINKISLAESNEQEQKKYDSKGEENQLIQNNNTTLVNTSTSQTISNEKEQQKVNVTKAEEKELIQNKNSILLADTYLDINKASLTKSNEKEQNIDNLTKGEEKQLIQNKNSTLLADTSLNINKEILTKSIEQEQKKVNVSKEEENQLIQSENSTLLVGASLNINKRNLDESKDQKQKKDDVSKEAKNLLIQNKNKSLLGDTFLNIDKMILSKSKEQEQKTDKVSKEERTQLIQDNNSKLLVDTALNINKINLAESNEPEQKKDDVLKREKKKLIQNKNITLLVKTSLDINKTSLTKTNAKENESLMETSDEGTKELENVEEIINSNRELNKPDKMPLDGSHSKDALYDVEKPLENAKKSSTSTDIKLNDNSNETLPNICLKPNETPKVDKNATERKLQNELESNKKPELIISKAPTSLAKTTTTTEKESSVGLKINPPIFNQKDSKVSTENNDKTSEITPKKSNLVDQLDVVDALLKPNVKDAELTKINIVEMDTKSVIPDKVTICNAKKTSAVEATIISTQKEVISSKKLNTQVEEKDTSKSLTDPTSNILTKTSINTTRITGSAVDADVKNHKVESKVSIPQLNTSINSESKNCIDLLNQSDVFKLPIDNQKSKLETKSDNNTTDKEIGSSTLITEKSPACKLEVEIQKEPVFHQKKDTIELCRKKETPKIPSDKKPVNDNKNQNATKNLDPPGIKKSTLKNKEISNLLIDSNEKGTNKPSEHATSPKDNIITSLEKNHKSNDLKLSKMDSTSENPKEIQPDISKSESDKTIEEKKKTECKTDTKSEIVKAARNVKTENLELANPKSSEITIFNESLKEGKALENKNVSSRNKEAPKVKPGIEHKTKVNITATKKAAVTCEKSKLQENQSTNVKLGNLNVFPISDDKNEKSTAISVPEKRAKLVENVDNFKNEDAKLSQILTKLDKESTDNKSVNIAQHIKAQVETINKFVIQSDKEKSIILNNKANKKDSLTPKSEEIVKIENNTHKKSKIEDKKLELVQEEKNKSEAVKEIYFMSPAKVCKNTQDDKVIEASQKKLSTSEQLKISKKLESENQCNLTQENYPKSTKEKDRSTTAKSSKTGSNSKNIETEVGLKSNNSIVSDETDGTPLKLGKEQIKKSDELKTKTVCSSQENGRNVSNKKPTNEVKVKTNLNKKEKTVLSQKSKFDDEPLPSNADKVISDDSRNVSTFLQEPVISEEKVLKKLKISPVLDKTTVIDEDLNTNSLSSKQVVVMDCKSDIKSKIETDAILSKPSKETVSKVTRRNSPRLNYNKKKVKESLQNVNSKLKENEIKIEESAIISTNKNEESKTKELPPETFINDGKKEINTIPKCDEVNKVESLVSKEDLHNKEEIKSSNVESQKEATKQLKNVTTKSSSPALSSVNVIKNKVLEHEKNTLKLKEPEEKNNKSIKDCQQIETPIKHSSQPSAKFQEVKRKNSDDKIYSKIPKQSLPLKNVSKDLKENQDQKSADNKELITNANQLPLNETIKVCPSSEIQNKLETNKNSQVNTENLKKQKLESSNLKLIEDDKNSKKLELEDFLPEKKVKNKKTQGENYSSGEKITNLQENSKVPPSSPKYEKNNVTESKSKTVSNSKNSRTSKEKSANESIISAEKNIIKEYEKKPRKDEEPKTEVNLNNDLLNNVINETKQKPKNKTETKEKAEKSTKLLKDKSETLNLKTDETNVVPVSSVKHEDVSIPLAGRQKSVIIEKPGQTLKSAKVPTNSKLEGVSKLKNKIDVKIETNLSTQSNSKNLPIGDSTSVSYDSIKEKETSENAIKLEYKKTMQEKSVTYNSNSVQPIKSKEVPKDKPNIVSRKRESAKVSAIAKSRKVETSSVKEESKVEVKENEKVQVSQPKPQDDQSAGVNDNIEKFSQSKEVDLIMGKVVEELKSEKDPKSNSTKWLEKEKSSTGKSKPDILNVSSMQTSKKVDQAKPYLKINESDAKLKNIAPSDVVDQSKESEDLQVKFDNQVEEIPTKVVPYDQFVVEFQKENIDSPQKSEIVNFSSTPKSAKSSKGKTAKTEINSKNLTDISEESKHHINLSSLGTSTKFESEKRMSTCKNLETSKTEPKNQIKLPNKKNSEPPTSKVDKKSKVIITEIIEIKGPTLESNSLNLKEKFCNLPNKTNTFELATQKVKKSNEAATKVIQDTFSGLLGAIPSKSSIGINEIKENLTEDKNISKEHIYLDSITPVGSTSFNENKGLKITENRCRKAENLKITDVIKCSDQIIESNRRINKCAIKNEAFNTSDGKTNFTKKFVKFNLDKEQNIISNLGKVDEIKVKDITVNNQINVSESTTEIESPIDNLLMLSTVIAEQPALEITNKSFEEVTEKRSRIKMGSKNKNDRDTSSNADIKNTLPKKPTNHCIESILGKSLVEGDNKKVARSKSCDEDSKILSERRRSVDSKNIKILENFEVPKAVTKKRVSFSETSDIYHISDKSTPKKKWETLSNEESYENSSIKPSIINISDNKINQCSKKESKTIEGVINKCKIIKMTEIKNMENLKDSNFTVTENLKQQSTLSYSHSKVSEPKSTKEELVLIKEDDKLVGKRKRESKEDCRQSKKMLLESNISEFKLPLAKSTNTADGENHFEILPGSSSADVSPSKIMSGDCNNAKPVPGTSINNESTTNTCPKDNIINILKNSLNEVVANLKENTQNVKSTAESDGFEYSNIEDIDNAKVKVESLPQFAYLSHQTLTGGDEDSFGGPILNQSIKSNEQIDKDGPFEIEKKNENYSAVKTAINNLSVDDNFTLLEDGTNEFQDGSNEFHFFGQDNFFVESDALLVADNSECQSKKHEDLSCILINEARSKMSNFPKHDDILSIIEQSGSKDNNDDDFEEVEPMNVQNLTQYLSMVDGTTSDYDYQKLINVDDKNNYNTSKNSLFGTFEKASHNDSDCGTDLEGIMRFANEFGLDNADEHNFQGKNISNFAWTLDEVLKEKEKLNSSNSVPGTSNLNVENKTNNSKNPIEQEINNVNFTEKSHKNNQNNPGLISKVNSVPDMLNIHVQNEPINQNIKMGNENYKTDCLIENNSRNVNPSKNLKEQETNNLNYTEKNQNNNPGLIAKINSTTDTLNIHVENESPNKNFIGNENSRNINLKEKPKNTKIIENNLPISSSPPKQESPVNFLRKVVDTSNQKPPLPSTPEVKTNIYPNSTRSVPPNTTNVVLVEESNKSKKSDLESLEESPLEIKSSPIKKRETRSSKEGSSKDILKPLGELDSENKKRRTKNSIDNEELQNRPEFRVMKNNLANVTPKINEEIIKDKKYQSKALIDPTPSKSKSSPIPSSTVKLDGKKGTKRPYKEENIFESDKFSKELNAEAEVKRKKPKNDPQQKQELNFRKSNIQQDSIPIKPAKEKEETKKQSKYKHDVLGDAKAQRSYGSPNTLEPNKVYNEKGTYSKNVNNRGSTEISNSSKKQDNPQSSISRNRTDKRVVEEKKSEQSSSRKSRTETISSSPMSIPLGIPKNLTTFDNSKTKISTKSSNKVENYDTGRKQRNESWDDDDIVHKGYKSKKNEEFEGYKTRNKNSKQKSSKQRDGSYSPSMEVLNSPQTGRVTRSSKMQIKIEPVNANIYDIQGEFESSTDDERDPYNQGPLDITFEGRITMPRMNTRTRSRQNSFLEESSRSKNFYKSYRSPFDDPPVKKPPKTQEKLSELFDRVQQTDLNPVPDNRRNFLNDSFSNKGHYTKPPLIDPAEVSKNFQKQQQNEAASSKKVCAVPPMIRKPIKPTSEACPRRTSMQTSSRFSSESSLSGERRRQNPYSVSEISNPSYSLPKYHRESQPVYINFNTIQAKKFKKEFIEHCGRNS